MVLLPSFQIAFDGMHTMPGRGMYLCPDGGCFNRAFKNRKGRKHFRDDEQIQDLYRGILVTLCDSIAQHIELVRTRRHLDDAGRIDNLRKGDIVVVNGGMHSGQRENVHAAAQESGSEVFDIPGNCMKEAAVVVVNDSFPMITRLKRYLRLYERLSSKGLVL